MKKQFNLTAPNNKPERHIDAIKHEIRKYIAREQRKPVPTGVDFWDFDCKIGDTVESAVAIHVSEITKKIEQLVVENKENFYLEILAKPGHRSRKK
jgi:hypothetical protein